MIDVIDDEVQNLNDKIISQKYAYVISREQYYQKLDEEISSLNADSQAQIDQIKELEHGIMKISWNESKLSKSINKIVNQQVLFDSLEFFVKENKLLCVNFQKE